MAEPALYRLMAGSVDGYPFDKHTPQASRGMGRRQIRKRDKNKAGLPTIDNFVAY